MPLISELEKYKQLLDDGAINEEEFRELKHHLLGFEMVSEEIPTQNQEKIFPVPVIEPPYVEETPVVYTETVLSEQSPAKKQVTLQENLSTEPYSPAPVIEPPYVKETPVVYTETVLSEQFSAEKQITLQENLSTESYSPPPHPIPTTFKSTLSTLKNIFCWFLTVFLGLAGLGAFSSTTSRNYVTDFFCGIILIVLALFACPPISKKLKQNPTLAVNWKYKKVIIILLIIILFIIIGVSSK